MNRIWSLRTVPCLVATVVPSISGNRSRCTPSRLTSAPPTRSDRRDLVDLVEEDDAVLLDQVDGLGDDLVLIEQIVALLRHQQFIAFADAQALGLGRAAAQRLAEHVVEIDHAHLRARHAGDVEGRQAGAAAAQFEFDFLAVELAVAQPLAEALPGFVTRILADQCIEHPLLGRDLGFRRHRFAQPLPCHADGDLDQVADDLLDIAADITDLGELGRLDLQEWGVGQAGQASRAISVLPHAGRPDHQDILRQHLLAS